MQDVFSMEVFRTKRRAIVEGESWLVLGKSKLGLERIDLSPVLQNFLLRLGKVDTHIGRSQSRVECCHGVWGSAC
jgi:hypothetical protein